MSDMLLKGCGTALVTPFTEDGGIDTAAYAALTHLVTAFDVIVAPVSA